MMYMINDNTQQNTCLSQRELENAVIEEDNHQGQRHSAHLVLSPVFVKRLNSSILWYSSQVKLTMWII